jgi:hypothetical protein
MSPQPSTTHAETATRERTLLRAEGAIVGTQTVRFDALVLPIADVRAVRTEGDERSGTFGLLLAANLFVAAAVAFWLPVIAGEWGPKFLIAVVLLGGVGASLLQDAWSVPDRHVTKLVVLTGDGERTVYVSKNGALVERIADTILEAKRGIEPLPPPQPLDIKAAARAFAARRRPLARGHQECEAGADPATLIRTSA